MTATATMIAQVRRWTNEPEPEEDAETGYSDEALTAIIESYPAMDERGVLPYYYNPATDPPQQVAMPGWYPTYDLHAAAAHVWEEKASQKADDYDYTTTDPQGVSRHSQVYEQYMKQARYHQSRRKMGTVQLIMSPSPNARGDSYIGNLPEVD